MAQVSFAVEPQAQIDSTPASGSGHAGLSVRSGQENVLADSSLSPVVLVECVAAAIPLGCGWLDL